MTCPSCDGKGHIIPKGDISKGGICAQCSGSGQMTHVPMLRVILKRSLLSTIRIICRCKTIQIVEVPSIAKVDGIKIIHDCITCGRGFAISTDNGEWKIEPLGSSYQGAKQAQNFPGKPGNA